MLLDIRTTADKGRVVTLMEDLQIFWQNRKITVPIGFESDGASVPRAFWRLVFPKIDEKAIRGAIAHDWLYRTHPEGWTKAEADRMFYDLMLEDGTPKWRAFLAYKGVEYFGGRAWKTRGEC